MSIRGFLHFGGHRELLFILPEPAYYGGGEWRIYDIGEENFVGALRGRGDRQVHPLVWYDRHPQVRKALLAAQQKKPHRERPKISIPRPVI